MNNGFYVFGGYISGRSSSVISRLDALSETWAKVGQLTFARNSHGAIFNGDVFIVAGGWNEAFATEACSITQNGASDTKIKCVKQAPVLADYDWYPEMFLISDAFCKGP